MYGVYVNEDGGIRYALAIVQSLKPVETRSRNTLKQLVGERVAIIRTKRNKEPMVVGYADIARWEFCPYCLFEMYRADTLIPPGSKYDCTSRGKYFYWLENAEPCEPYSLPKDRINHGRSYTEF